MNDQKLKLKYLKLTVDMHIELLRVVGRHPVECLADVGPHVGAVDVGDV